MNKSELYRQELHKRGDWDDYLRSESGLPGPRGNLELAQVVADEGSAELFERYVLFTPQKASTNSPDVFLAFCGVVGFGRLLAEGNKEYLIRIRQFASDPRWRIREGVAMALQKFGETDMDGLIDEMDEWSKGTLLEQRAAVAALCEPKLLKHEHHTKLILNILDKITSQVDKQRERKSEDFQVLRKGLGYCWSVAVAALPAEGKKMMEKWVSSEDKDIRWIMRENLQKNRLLRCDEKWTRKLLDKIR
jgi:hypothetical protein